MDIDILAGKIVVAISLVAWLVYWVVDYMAAREARKFPRANIRR
jgi:hypothetical protein